MCSPGQILFVSWSDIAAFLPIYVVVASLWMAVPGMRSGAGFFVLFALAITASVQLVGVYVVFASLILPALSAHRGGEYVLGRALASGAAAVTVAIVVSAYADLPAGPSLVRGGSLVPRGPAGPGGCLNSTRRAPHRRAPPRSQWAFRAGSRARD